jgi:hypothetical protein
LIDRLIETGDCLKKDWHLFSFSFFAAVVADFFAAVVGTYFCVLLLSLLTHSLTISVLFTLLCVCVVPCCLLYYCDLEDFHFWSSDRRVQ